MSGVLCVLALSSTRCSANSLGVARSTVCRKWRNSALRCRRWTSVMTAPALTSSAAKRSVVPWRMESCV